MWLYHSFEIQLGFFVSVCYPFSFFYILVFCFWNIKHDFQSWNYIKGYPQRSVIPLPHPLYPSPVLSCRSLTSLGFHLSFPGFFLYKWEVVYFLISPPFLHKRKHTIDSLLYFAFFHLTIYPGNHSILLLNDLIVFWNCIVLQCVDVQFIHPLS